MSGNRMALRKLKEGPEGRAMLACLDTAVQLQRALDRWLVEERNDSVTKRLRGRQKRVTDVGLVIQHASTSLRGTRGPARRL